MLAMKGWTAATRYALLFDFVGSPDRRPLCCSIILSVMLMGSLSSAVDFSELELDFLPDEVRLCSHRSRDRLLSGHEKS